MAYYFDEFFASGRQETTSPFLIPSSRKWGKNLTLRIALLAAFCLIVAFVTSFMSSPLSHLFLILVYFFAGTPALIGALEDLKNLEINIDVLMTLAALLSVLIGSGMEGALLLVLFELSAAMEGAVEHKAKSTLINLHRLAPTKATVVDPKGELFECSIKAITVGAHLLIKAGETVPLDGTVIEGSSSVNLAHLTGESIPIPKKKGDAIPAGARNLDGTLTLKVTHTSADSTLSHIIHLITQATQAKPRVERFLSRFGKAYSLAVISLSILFALFLPLFSLPFLGTEGSIYRALTFLIAASPCALIIATPTAYLSSISSCTRRGILLKGGVIFDALARAKAVAFDKTGTLTTGKLTLTNITPLTPHTTIDTTLALRLAAAMERGAVHPIAEAISQKAKNLPPIPLTHFKALPGQGLEATATLNDKPLTLHIGNPDYIATFTTIPSLDTKEEMHTLLLIDNSLFLFTFQDTLRPHIPEMLAALKQQNRHLVMLTGDHPKSAELIGKQAGIDTIYASLSPADKLAHVTALSAQEGLAMVGEGMNDAPALARATVGITLGQIGSATAIDASDVVFLHDDLTHLPWLFHQAKKTLSIVRQNITLSLLIILLASTPALLGFIPLWLAVILHEGGTILVALSSLRLLK